MDSKEFRLRGKEMIDIVADYLDNIEKKECIAKSKTWLLERLSTRSCARRAR